MTTDHPIDPVGRVTDSLTGGREGEASATRPVALALYLSVLFLGLVLIGLALSSSERNGRLSLLPTYDDCQYFRWGFDVYQDYLRRGVAATGDLFTQHAPIQSLLAILVYSLFGKDLWWMYAANGIFVLGFLAFLLHLTRGIPPVARLGMACAAVGAPIMTFAVTEFRPDIYHGLSCGIAVHLIMRHRFIEGDWRDAAFAGGVFAFALLAKPTAFPATLVVCGAALVAAAALAQLGYFGESQPDTRQVIRQSGIFLLTAAILAGPYYAVSLGEISRYIYDALVGYGQFYDVHGSFWFHASYYSIGAAYPFGLARFLWIGLAAIVGSFVVLSSERPRHRLVRHAAYAAIVLLTYLIPTLARQNAFLPGAMFFGSFIVFAAHSFALTLRSLGPARRSSIAWGAALLFAAASIQGMAANGPLKGLRKAPSSPDFRVTGNRVIDMVADRIERRPDRQPATIVVPAPYPAVNAGFVELAARWRNLPLEVDGAYFTESVPEFERKFASAAFVLIADDPAGRLPDGPIGRLPGHKLTPKLKELLLARDDFTVSFEHLYPDGERLYLFERR